MNRSIEFIDIGRADTSKKKFRVPSVEALPSTESTFDDLRQFGRSMDRSERAAPVMNGPGDFPMPLIFAVEPNDSAERRFVQSIDEIRCRDTLRLRVHSHVQRAIVSKTETARRIVELHRTKSQFNDRKRAGDDGKTSFQRREEFHRRSFLCPEKSFSID